MKVKRKKGYFSISAVAKMFSVHQQTIRLYEKEGLITPKRSEGKTRLFSDEDIDRLENIIYLTHELGINLAGVEMILKLKKQITKMQQEMNKLFKDAQQQLDDDVNISKKAVVSSAQKLMKMRMKEKSLQENLLEPISQTSQDVDAHTVDVDNWEIEYDE
jgi:MerR family transcriptional regulator/heat shock protein HspR